MTEGQTNIVVAIESALSDRCTRPSVVRCVYINICVWPGRVGLSCALATKALACAVRDTERYLRFDRTNHCVPGRRRGFWPAAITRCPPSSLGLVCPDDNTINNCLLPVVPSPRPARPDDDGGSTEPMAYARCTTRLRVRVVG